jgi:tripartite-type tricarboxylate transporter receptor subunit TctC
MKTCLRALAMLACLALCPATMQAQTYPAKPVHLIVPYAAGGATDVIARAIGQRLSETWGQQVIIENKAGAGTQIGAEAVAKSAADGYTLLATAEATFVVNPYVYSKLPYDPVKDFVPVSGLGVLNQVLVVHPSLPVQSVGELIARAKAKPGELNYGTLGIGSSSHLNMEMFQSQAGVKLTSVHYRGGAPAMTDLIGGHIPMLFISVTLTAQPWKAGQIRALGVGSSQRLPQFPELPTVAESGLPGFSAVTWFGLFAPSGTPPEIVTKINTDVQRLLADPGFKEKFLDPNFFEPITGSPEQFAAYVQAEAAKWSKVIKEANLKID